MKAGSQRKKSIKTTGTGDWDQLFYHFPKSVVGRNETWALSGKLEQEPALTDKGIDNSAAAIDGMMGNHGSPFDSAMQGSSGPTLMAIGDEQEPFPVPSEAILTISPHK